MNYFLNAKNASKKEAVKVMIPATLFDDAPAFPITFPVTFDDRKNKLKTNPATAPSPNNFFVKS